MKLTENVSDAELFCKCTYQDCNMKRISAQYSQKLADVIQDVVNHFSTVFNKPVKVKINCGNRCKKHNYDVNGEPNSFHMLMMAADIALYIVDGGRIAPNLVADYLEKKYPTSKGIGRYKTFTHIDVRLTKGRWDETK